MDASQGGIASAGGDAIDNSIEDQMNVQIGDIAVNLSQLEGTVTGKSVAVTANGGSTTDERRGEPNNDSRVDISYEADNSITNSFHGGCDPQ